jgi:hypothetical protein
MSLLHSSELSYWSDLKVTPLEMLNGELLQRGYTEVILQIAIRSCFSAEQS